VKGIKALTEEQKTIVENAWYQYDEDGSESLDFYEVLTIMSIMHTEFPEEDARELYESMDDDGDKKVSFTEYMKHMEKHLKKFPLVQVNELLANLTKGPPGSEEWVKRDARSEEEERALKGLQGVKYLVKPEMLEALRRTSQPPKGIDVVCDAAMRLLGVPPPSPMAWQAAQQWLKGGEELIFKLAGLHKRIDCGQVHEKVISFVRNMIVQSPEAFNSAKYQAIEGREAEAGACAAQLANWVLICVRYFDAVRSNMQMTLQNQTAGGIDGPAFAAAILPVREAIPKALESFHVHKVPILYDSKDLAAQFLKYKKAKMIDVSDKRNLFKAGLHKNLCHCIKQGVPLVLDYGQMANEHRRQM